MNPLAQLQAFASRYRLQLGAGAAAVVVALAVRARRAGAAGDTAANAPTRTVLQPAATSNTSSADVASLYSGWLQNIQDQVDLLNKPAAAAPTMTPPPVLPPGPGQVFDPGTEYPQPFGGGGAGGIVSTAKAPGGGSWEVSADGSVYAINGAPYLGGPAGHAYWGARRAKRITAEPSGYFVTATTGETYHFP